MKNKAMPFLPCQKIEVKVDFYEIGPKNVDFRKNPKNALFAPDFWKMVTICVFYKKRPKKRRYIPLFGGG